MTRHSEAESSTMILLRAGARLPLAEGIGPVETMFLDQLPPDMYLADRSQMKPLELSGKCFIPHIQLLRRARERGLSIAL